MSSWQRTKSVNNRMKFIGVAALLIITQSSKIQSSENSSIHASLILNNNCLSNFRWISWIQPESMKYVWRLHKVFKVLFLKNFWRTWVLFGGGHWYPYFGLLVTSPLGFKARVDLSLVCFVACMQWIPEIHLWCNTCWLYKCQHGSRSHSLHATYVAEVGCLDSIRRPPA